MMVEAASVDKRWWSKTWKTCFLARGQWAFSVCFWIEQEYKITAPHPDNGAQMERIVVGFLFGIFCLTSGKIPYFAGFLKESVGGGLGAAHPHAPNRSENGPWRR